MIKILKIKLWFLERVEDVFSFFAGLLDSIYWRLEERIHLTDCAIAEKEWNKVNGI